MSCFSYNTTYVLIFAKYEQFERIMAQLKEFKGPQIMQDQINVIILGFTEDSPLPEKRVIYANLQEEATEAQGKFQVGQQCGHVP